MKKIITASLTLAAVGVLLLHVPRVSAQDDAPPPPPAGAPAAGGPGAGGPGGPGGGGRGQFRQQMAERIKTALKASDDEWSVIEPLLTAVEEKQRATMTGRFGGMMGGPGGPGGPGGGGRGQWRNGGQGGQGGNQPGAAGQPNGGPGRGGSPEAQALTEALQNDSTSAADIKAKLAALREQRKKANADLTQARENLKKVLNMRQEAVLVSMGIVD